MQSHFGSLGLQITVFLIMVIFVSLDPTMEIGNLDLHHLTRRVLKSSKLTTCPIKVFAHIVIKFMQSQVDL